MAADRFNLPFQQLLTATPTVRVGHKLKFYASGSATPLAIYTDSATRCDAIKGKTPDLGAATYRLVVNFVIQFKDEASAAKGYTTEGVFNISASELKNSGQPVVEGAKTGLSANSIVLNTAIANQTYFIAVWQKKVFMVILAVLNIDATAAKKVASSENDRIK